MNTPRFLVCPRCKNIVTMVEDKGVPVNCCGTKMEELVANTTDASNEKHLPAISVDGNNVIVTVGTVTHPMQEEHYISWVYLHTTNGGQLHYLDKTGEPKTIFSLAEGEKAIAAFAYCNLHGLWKTEI